MTSAIQNSAFRIHHSRRTPLSTVGRTEHRQTVPTSERGECPECHKEFCASAVVDGPMTRDPLTRRQHRSRMLYCDHCEHLVHFVQLFQDDGTPGPLLCQPAIYRSADRVAKFLRDHPEAAGVEQS